MGRMAAVGFEGSGGGGGEGVLMRCIGQEDLYLDRRRVGEQGGRGEGGRIAGNGMVLEAGLCKTGGAL